MAIEDPESFGVFHRLNRLDQELHTLKFRADELAGHNLPIRVANLESAVKNISQDASKIESSVGDMSDMMASVSQDVASMKAWGKGVSITIAALFALVNFFPIIKGWLV